MNFIEPEDVFGKDSRRKRHEYLKLLDHELSFWIKNQKTSDLRKKVAAALAEAPARQTVLFDQPTPSSSARRADTRASAAHTKPRTHKKPKFTPREEQAAATRLLPAGKSGKTSTLQLLANTTGVVAEAKARVSS